MNVIGFGSGVKNIFSIGKDWLTEKKVTVTAETDKAK